MSIGGTHSGTQSREPEIIERLRICRDRKPNYESVPRNNLTEQNKVLDLKTRHYKFLKIQVMSRPLRPSN